MSERETSETSEDGYIEQSFEEMFISDKDIVGFHMTSLKFKLKTIDPNEILLSRCIRAAEN